MNARSWTTRTLMAAVVISAGAGALTAAQPGSSGTAPAGQGGGNAVAQPTDAKGVREWIEQRLNDHRQGVKRLEEALKKLEAGGDPAVIGKELLDSARESRRNATGGGRPERTGDEQPGRAGGGQRSNAGTGGGGMGGGRGSEFDMLSGPRLNADDRAKVRGKLQERHPDLLAKLVLLGGGSTEMTDRLIDGVGGRFRWLDAMREKEPAEYNLRVSELSAGLDVLKLGREVTDAKAAGNSAAESAARRSSAPP